MAQRRPNPRLAKIHRSYTVQETAQLFRVHRNTVREWLRQGLPVCDDSRPLLILGRDLGDFLRAKRARGKRPCQPGEIYCVRCREPQMPAVGMADYQPLTRTSGNLVGLCPRCGGLIYRRVNLARLALAQGSLDVRFPKAADHIAESVKPSVNSDFTRGA